AFRGEGLLPEDWVSHGADLVAAADGTIQDARDGVPDNTPVGAYVVPMTSENAFGNYVVLDVGNRHQAFAVYAHLVPGSLRVKTGDAVVAGQVLGKLGNSGNSGAPHLHFHVCDGLGPMGGAGEAFYCNGLPYEIPAVTLLGTMPFDDVNAGIPFVPHDPPGSLVNELVLGEQVLNLGP
ncbi:MAG: M23 family metallopeptidase, partial [Deltaproteobacteria bacterium]